MQKYFLSLSFAIFTVYSAFAQAKEVNVIFKHTVNGEPLKLNETFFPIWNGKKIILKRAEFYLSQFSLTGKDGSVVSFPENYMLINAKDTHNTRHLVGTIENMDIDLLSFYIGVDKDKNHLDPTLYPSDHPLALKDPSMHWGWAGGYRFMAIEGQVDLDNSGSTETDLEYHNLGDDLYKQANITVNVDESPSSIDIVLILDYAKLFDNLTLIGNNIVHGSAAKNSTMLNNATRGGFVRQEVLSSSDEVQGNEVLNIHNDQNFIVFNLTQAVENAILKVYNTSGNSIYEQRVDGVDIQINKSNLPSQLLIFTLSKNDKIIALRKYFNQ
jgi:hypothetical protein